MKAYLTLLLLWLGALLPASAQDLSHKGEDFWLVRPLSINSGKLVVYMSAGAATATVTITANTESATWQKVYTIPANTVIVSDPIPPGLELSDGVNTPERVFDRSIHITSDNPIVAYAHFYCYVYSGATLLVAQQHWGYDYSSVGSPGDFNGYVCVLASEDNTLVEITPAVNTSLGHVAGVPYTITLNKGQVYQFLSGMNTGELTGTHIRSITNSAGACYPVAVFSGSAGAAICATSSDFLIQQLFPYQTWGKRYITAPFSSSTSNTGHAFNTAIYRVVVKDPATVVKCNGVTLTGLVNNLFYEFNSNEGTYIEADQPVMVAQFMPSQYQVNPPCPFTNTGYGDPEVIILSPIEQGIKRTDFYLSYQVTIIYNYLTLIIPTAGLPSLTIDGSHTFSDTYPHPHIPGYTVVTQRWIATGKPCLVKSDSAFTAISYGLGDYESYGYNVTPLKNLAAQPLLANLPDRGAVTDNTCMGTLFKLVLKTVYQPSRIEWDISKIPALRQAGNPVTANIVLTTPVPDSTFTENGTLYYIYSSPLYYTVNKAGPFTLPTLVTSIAIGSCSNIQTFTGYLNANPSALAAFQPPGAICLPYGSASFINQSTDPDHAGTPLNYQWDFGDASPRSTDRDPIHHYTGKGSYFVVLTTTAANGCVDTAGYRLSSFVDRPAITFNSSAPEICTGLPLTLTDHSTPGTGSAITGWHWDLGDGRLADDPQLQPVYNRSGDYNIQEFVVSKEGCHSDTMTTALKVDETPFVDAGPDRAIQQGGSIMLQGSVSNADPASIRWTPAVGLNADNIPTPMASPSADQRYYLTAASGICTATDSADVKILLDFHIPNAFSPNGDGIHDVWEIPGLNSYSDATVQVFNRWGQKVFESKGYPVPWDGRSNGSFLPAGTYYYIISPGFGKPRLSGAINLLR